MLAERLGPHEDQIRDRALGGGEPILDPLPVPVVLNETRILEDPELLRDVWLGQSKTLDESTDVVRAFEQDLEYGEPIPVAERLESFRCNWHVLPPMRPLGR
jgi:hypothetical protein